MPSNILPVHKAGNTGWCILVVGIDRGWIGYQVTVMFEVTIRWTGVLHGIVRTVLVGSRIYSMLGIVSVLLANTELANGSLPKRVTFAPGIKPWSMIQANGGRF